MAFRLVQPNYLPTGYDARNAWLGTFANALPGFADALGVTPAQVAQVQGASQQFSYLLTQLIPTARAYSKGLTALMEEFDTDSAPQLITYPSFNAPPAPVLTPGLSTGLFNMVTDLVSSVILPSPALTAAMKTALGLDPIAPPAPGQTLIRDAEAMPGGQVDLTMTRGGAKQIIIEARRADESDFIMLDKVVANHYVDTRPNQTPGQSEVRQYRVRGSDGSQATGQYSPVVTVATQV